MTAVFFNGFLALVLNLGAADHHHAFDGGGLPAPVWQPETEVANRDKRGTSASFQIESDLQVAKNKPNASRSSFEAEDKGFEPSTGFPAPDFESGR